MQIKTSLLLLSFLLFYWCVCFIMCLLTCSNSCFTEGFEKGFLTIIRYQVLSDSIFTDDRLQYLLISSGIRGEQVKNGVLSQRMCQFNVSFFYCLKKTKNQLYHCCLPDTWQQVQVAPILLDIVADLGCYLFHLLNETNDEFITLQHCCNVIFSFSSAAWKIFAVQHLFCLLK